MSVNHFVCSVHFPTVQKHTGIKTIPHFYWKNDKGVEPANGIQPLFLETLFTLALRLVETDEMISRS